MRYLSLIALLALGGCDVVDSWEFNKRVPGEMSVSELLQIEKALRESGYKRVRISHNCDWVSISATRTEGKTE